MKALNLTTLILLIVGGINWLLIGVADFNFVAALFGGEDAALTRVVYALVGLSALWQLAPLTRAFRIDEPLAESRSPTLRHR